MTLSMGQFHNQRQFKGLLVDLDGTLMETDTIRPRVVEAIARVSALVPVAIATGRRASDVAAYAGQLGLSAPQICNGGATLLDPTSGESLWNSHLPQRRAREIVGLVAEKGINFIATHPEGDSVSLVGIHSWDLTRISAMDISETDADDLAAVFDPAPDLNVVKVYLHYNGLWAVDFTAAGIHKGEAAQRWAAMVRICPRQIIAAGDSFNDLPMLKAAGYGIVMDSAPEEMKGMADYVAPPVERDGLAVAIEEVVLPLISRCGE